MLLIRQLNLLIREYAEVDRDYDHQENETISFAKSLPLHLVFEVLVAEMLRSAVGCLLNEFHHFVPSFGKSGEAFEFLSSLSIDGLLQDLLKARLHFLIIEARFGVREMRFHVEFVFMSLHVKQDASFLVHDELRIHWLIRKMWEAHHRNSCASEFEDAAPAAVTQPTLDSGVVQDLNLWDPGADPEIVLKSWFLIEKGQPFVLKRPHDPTLDTLEPLRDGIYAPLLPQSDRADRDVDDVLALAERILEPLVEYLVLFLQLLHQKLRFLRHRADHVDVRRQAIRLLQPPEAVQQVYIPMLPLQRLTVESERLQPMEAVHDPAQARLLEANHSAAHRRLPHVEHIVPGEGPECRRHGCVDHDRNAQIVGSDEAADGEVVAEDDVRLQLLELVHDVRVPALQVLVVGVRAHRLVLLHRVL